MVGVTVSRQKVVVCDNGTGVCSANHLARDLKLPQPVKVLDAIAVCQVWFRGRQLSESFVSLHGWSANAPFRRRILRTTVDGTNVTATSSLHSTTTLMKRVLV